MIYIHHYTFDFFTVHAAGLPHPEIGLDLEEKLNRTV